MTLLISYLEGVVDDFNVAAVDTRGAYQTGW